MRGTYEVATGAGNEWGSTCMKKAILIFILINRKNYLVLFQGVGSSSQNSIDRH